MPTEIVMPRLSDSMEEGVILKWLKRQGEEVARGEDLVEIETDKANMSYASDTAGVLCEIVAEEGATLPVGTVIARIEATKASSASKPPGNAKVKASPLARRLAREAGVELETLLGSGPNGRIVKADVEAAMGAPASERVVDETVGPSAPPSSEVAAAKGQVESVELTRSQRTVVRRMAESKATVPNFELSVEVDMSACVALRRKLKEIAGEQVPTYNDMVVKAAALALREFAKANGAYRDGKWELYSRVNVGVAVAAEDELLVVTVFDADEKSMGEIAREVGTLAERVRAGTITPPELAGGTFTVSNLGMYGIASFTAIINPPQAAILAVGAVRAQPLVDEDTGAIFVGHSMWATLACDHRILYGAEAAKFLGRIRALLEQPEALSL